MKRLRDIEPETELQQKAQQLLRAVDPMPASPERMARVRRRLDQASGAPAMVRRLPAVAIAGAIALFGASAFAAVRVFVEVREAREAREAQASEAAQQAERARAARVKRVEAPEVEPAPAPQAPLEAPQALGLKPEEAPTEEGRALRSPTRTRTKAPLRAAQEEQAELVHDSELVHRAVKALRRDDNPALAARLLEQDRVRNPSGPLAEEALSLRIEAALALGDARARALAQQYIARYPGGRYLALARRALREGSAK